MTSSELRNLKKQKEEAVDDDDGISQLSDALLIQILSLLPIDEAFTICILSKRWQYLWTLVDNFYFTCANYSDIKSYTGERLDDEEDSCRDYHQINPFATLSKNSICNFELLDLAKGDDMDLLSLVPSFVFPNLKNVKIVISPE
ncbi:hypothetical protein HAX54_050251 [Datura stramonium]|uniref:F-box domain-containing protein n=1 Tax=Datura stramonium TaxID=4076 RepID=A0ABS8WQ21_DATST|nr:hypothetical protein [Datura stramonium]